MNPIPESAEIPPVEIRLADLHGRIALVTGTSSGIGRATAQALLANGAIVHGADRAAATWSHEKFHAHPCDLADPEAIKRTVQTIGEMAGHLDYVANVAGVDTKHSLDEGGAAQWNTIVDINLRAFYLILHKAAPWLRLGRGKAVVNVSSINYRLGVPRRSIYATTKAAILGLTTGLARELGRDGIRINAVSPGWVFTEGQVAEYFSGDARAKHLAYLEQVQSLALKIDARDIANHILFYLSEVSRASTGHNCVVDAGWTLE